MVRISITGFDPLKVEIPKVERFAGEVEIALPAVHVQLYDLSMGMRELRGAHIGTDGQVFSLKMDIPEPGITQGQMLTFITAAQNELEEMWRTVQAEFDKKGALL